MSVIVVTATGLGVPGAVPALAGQPVLAEQVADLVPGSGGGDPRRFVVVGDTTFFTATDPAHGWELWKSDGTAAGTALVKDIRTGSSGSELYDLVDLGGSLFFSANDGVAGQELWKSDGTAAGTVLVKDISPGSYGSAPQDVTEAGGSLFFRAAGRLWKSDGTAEGTVLVKAVGPAADFTMVGSDVFFTAADGASGNELWKTDGTADGTVLVKDIRPGSADSYPYELTAVGGSLFFSADNGTTGRELWTSDGTAAGTVSVKDIRPGPSNSTPHQLTAVGGTLFFNATDGAAGAELWRSDGTAAGTVLVKDIRPGSADSYPYELTAVGGSLFFNATDGAAGRELWTSDGTAAGTVLVKDVRPGSSDSAPRDLTAVGTSLFFRADDGVAGQELWTSDGTAAGTVLVEDIGAGAAGSRPYELAAVGTSLYFSANDGVSGRELWRAAEVTAPPPDTTPPDTVITAGPAQGSTVTSRSVSFSFAGTVSDTAKLQCSLDGAGFADCVSPRVFSGLADGSHTVAFRAVDAAGNVDASPVMRSFTVDTSPPPDTTPPDTVITAGPAQGSTVTSRSVSFSFAGTAGDTAQVQCRLDGTVFLDCMSPMVFSGLADGPHTVAFQAVDAAGNADASPVVRSFTVAATPPAPSNQFTLGQAGMRSFAKASVVVPVRLPGSGRLVMAPVAGSKVAGVRVAVSRAGVVSVTVKPSGAGLRALRAKLRKAKLAGKNTVSVKVRVKYTFTPTGGTARSKSASYVLKLR